eukprot:CAMPEP_0194745710 /NCGR_PEP_ID=MMETSP0296-20130528/101553_1 /TAXON_ID=39354 /ORGANISM="Heterosigma akashiwo, Strain CCMP2393" /LENGTH=367 /DNA_ID=CAMNT_0039657951 /DNA_START=325 /DNA_END=1429 /DNA_ORIENTATION=+
MWRMFAALGDWFENYALLLLQSSMTSGMLLAVLSVSLFFFETASELGAIRRSLLYVLRSLLVIFQALVILGLCLFGQRMSNKGTSLKKTVMVVAGIFSVASLVLGGAAVHFSFSRNTNLHHTNNTDNNAASNQGYSKSLVQGFQQDCDTRRAPHIEGPRRVFDEVLGDQGYSKSLVSFTKRFTSCVVILVFSLVGAEFLDKDYKNVPAVFVHFAVQISYASIVYIWYIMYGFFLPSSRQAEQTRNNNRPRYDSSILVFNIVGMFERFGREALSQLATTPRSNNGQVRASPADAQSTKSSRAKKPEVGDTHQGGSRNYHSHNYPHVSRPKRSSVFLQRYRILALAGDSLTDRNHHGGPSTAASAAPTA